MVRYTVARTHIWQVRIKFSCELDLFLAFVICRSRELDEHYDVEYWLQSEC